MPKSHPSKAYLMKVSAEHLETTRKEFDETVKAFEDSEMEVLKIRRVAEKSEHDIRMIEHAMRESMHHIKRLEQDFQTDSSLGESDTEKKTISLMNKRVEDLQSDFEDRRSKMVGLFMKLAKAEKGLKKNRIIMIAKSRDLEEARTNMAKVKRFF